MRLVLCALLGLLALCHAAPPSPPTSPDLPAPTESKADEPEDADEAVSAEVTTDEEVDVSEEEGTAIEEEDTELEEDAEPEEEATEAASPAPPLSPPPQPADEDASVQFMVTAKMKGQLEALGYGDADIAQLRPARAAAIIARGIKRPSGGVPAAWNRVSRPSPLSKIRPAVQSAVRLTKHKSVALGGLAIIASLISTLALGKKQSSAPITVTTEPEVEPTPEFVSDSPFWIDRQLDKLEYWLKRKLSSGR